MRKLKRLSSIAVLTIICSGFVNTASWAGSTTLSGTFQGFANIEILQYVDGT
jgi:hypothetical protein